MDVVLPTLVVALCWPAIGLVLAGCGYLTRRLLLGVVARTPAGGLATADLWIGLAILLAYLQLWNLFLSVGRLAWLAPLGAGIAGLILGGRRLGRLSRSRRVTAVLALVGLGTLWAANRSLVPVEDYDFGLYHLGIIGYALHYATIPGLGNLHERFGAGDAHLLFTAFLERGPWGKVALRLPNGLLVAMLFVEVGSRFVRHSANRAGSFTARMALLLVPATIEVVGIRSSHRISSPNLDLATFVLVIIGLLYLADNVEHGFSPTAALASTATLAAAAVTRPLYWVTAAFAIALIACFAQRDAEQIRGHALRAVAVGWALPGVLFAGWMAREAVLTGYPFFPATIGALPVDWRIPVSVVHNQNNVDRAWARWPGIDTNVVLSSWGWLTKWWLDRQIWTFDVYAPLTLLACLVPSLARGRGRDPERRKRTTAMCAVLAPTVVTLVIWFFTAPDPRFVFAPLWALPIALSAWALPTRAIRLPGTLVLVVAVVGGALASLANYYPYWPLATALATTAVLVVIVRVLAPGRSTELIAYTAVFAVVVMVAGVVTWHGAFRPYVADHSGTLGTVPLAKAKLVFYQTNSGLQLWHTSADTDRCWEVLLCSPFQNFRLRLRGQTAADGFRVTPF